MALERQRYSQPRRLAKRLKLERQLSVTWGASFFAGGKKKKQYKFVDRSAVARKTIMSDKSRGQSASHSKHLLFLPASSTTTTPRPIPSAHQALAHPHRELSKATPCQSNLFFFLCPTRSRQFRASPSHHFAIAQRAHFSIGKLSHGRFVMSRFLPSSALVRAT